MVWTSLYGPNKSGMDKQRTSFLWRVTAVTVPQRHCCWVQCRHERCPHCAQQPHRKHATQCPRGDRDDDDAAPCWRVPLQQLTTNTASLRETRRESLSTCDRKWVDSHTSWRTRDSSTARSEPGRTDCRTCSRSRRRAGGCAGAARAQRRSPPLRWAADWPGVSWLTSSCYRRRRPSLDHDDDWCSARYTARTQLWRSAEWRKRTWRKCWRWTCQCSSRPATRISPLYCTNTPSHVTLSASSILHGRNVSISGAETNLKVGGGGTRQTRSVGKLLFGRVPPFFGSKSTISRFRERFRDRQYRLTSSVFAVLLLTVPPCPAICKSGGARAPVSYGVSATVVQQLSLLFWMQGSKYVGKRISKAQLNGGFTLRFGSTDQIEMSSATVWIGRMTRLAVIIINASFNQ